MVWQTVSSQWSLSAREVIHTGEVEIPEGIPAEALSNNSLVKKVPEKNEKESQPA